MPAATILNKTGIGPSGLDLERPSLYFSPMNKERIDSTSVGSPFPVGLDLLNPFQRYPVRRDLLFSGR